MLDGAGPDHRQRARFIHHADYIAGKLTGEYGITDWSNALKSGYDVVEEKWTDEAIAAFGTGIQKVVAPGTPREPKGHPENNADDRSP